MVLARNFDEALLNSNQRLDHLGHLHSKLLRQLAQRALDKKNEALLLFLIDQALKVLEPARFLRRLSMRLRKSYPLAVVNVEAPRNLQRQLAFWFNAWRPIVHQLQALVFTMQVLTTSTTTTMTTIMTRSQTIPSSILLLGDLPCDRFLFTLTRMIPHHLLSLPHRIPSNPFHLAPVVDSGVSSLTRLPLHHHLLHGNRITADNSDSHRWLKRRSHPLMKLLSLQLQLVRVVVVVVLTIRRVLMTMGTAGCGRVPLER
ncbi:hypothetical protein R3P38DRAFT_2786525 [Favolaschia claudopus]|uniref:Uncharacterized protein n=1 Tax=Favolaschia claudopus TaxID=2862362 RepID=A0AAW0ARZ0_9AGAR